MAEMFNNRKIVQRSRLSSRIKNIRSEMMQLIHITDGRGKNFHRSVKTPKFPSRRNFSGVKLIETAAAAVNKSIRSACYCALNFRPSVSPEGRAAVTLNEIY